MDQKTQGQTAAAAAEAATLRAAAVSVKFPNFWTTMAAAWFSQAEAQFGLRRITSDETRYWHVVASRDAETATQQHPSCNTLLQQVPILP